MSRFIHRLARPRLPGSAVCNWLIRVSCGVTFMWSCSILADGEASAWSYSYRCDGSLNVEVAYHKTAQGEAVAIVSSEGERHRLFRGVCASGEKYVAEDFSWWTKGAQGFLLNDGQSVLNRCQIVED